MINFKKQVAEILESQIEELSKKEILDMIEQPPSYDMGDYAFPVFSLAKIFRKAPPLIAEEIVENIKDNDYFEKIVATGPYINFFINKELFAKTTLEEVVKKGEKYGSGDIGHGENILIEFSSPNIAKPFHIGHIRSTVIGNSLAKIFKFLGYDVKRLNHLGDYGTQFGIMIAAYKRWGVKEEIEAEPIKALLDLYVRFNKKAEEDPELLKEAREWFVKLENGDEEAVELWQWFRDVSIKEFYKVYDMLHIDFDSLKGESFYSDKMPRVMKELEEKGLIRNDEGTKLVDLDEYDMPPLMVEKSDGSSLYSTRDLATAIYRKERFNFDKNIYVVASEQNLHFASFFKVLEMMGYEWAKDCIHIPFGMVSLEDGTLSTREGRVVYLEDVLNTAINKTLEIIEERNPDLENKEEVAKQVGIGSVLFQELFNQRIKDYTFSWERTLSLEGETGPYVQYTYARISSLLDRAGFDINTEVDASLLTEEEEINIIRELYNFPRVIVESSKAMEPFYITRQLIRIAQAYNRFYHKTNILLSGEELKNARLLLSYATKTTLKTGLALLGIEAPERM